MHMHPHSSNTSVFISYRRTNTYMARLIYDRLTASGFDVFFDYQNIAVGDFGQIILNNVASRTHFLPILTPSALERCINPSDWVRREIEHALNNRRNIIPIVTDKFDFADIGRYLPPHIAEPLSRYNALKLIIEYLDPGIDELVRRLRIPVACVPHPPRTPAAQRYAQQQQVAIANAPVPTRSQITAEYWFERGFALNDNSNRELDFYNQAIALRPDFAQALFNRAKVHKERGNHHAALRDLDAALQADPQHTDAYTNRGNLHFSLGDYNAALHDYNTAIRINPHDPLPYNNRSLILMRHGDYVGALADLNIAIQINPRYAISYRNRADVLRLIGDYQQAIADCNRAIHLKHDDSGAYTTRGVAYAALGYYRDALIDFDTALRLNPDDQFARVQREKVRNESGGFLRRWFGG